MAHALTTMDGRFIATDDGFCDIVQRADRDIVGKSILDLTFWLDRPRNHKDLAGLASEGGAFSITKRYVQPEGGLVWVRNHVSVLREGRATRLVAAVQRIAEGECVTAGVADEPDPLVSLFETTRGSLHAFQAGRRLIGRYFPASLFADPAFDMLMALFDAEAHGVELDAAYLYHCAGVTPTTGERWLRSLAAHDIVHEDGAGYGLYRGVRLTEAGLATLHQFAQDLTIVLAAPSAAES